MGNVCTKPSTKDESSTLAKYKKNSPKNKTKFEELEDLKTEYIGIPVFQKKMLAKKEYDEFVKNINVESQITSVKTKYIKIRKLLFLDDTNKNIAKLYLNFLKDHLKFINQNGLNNYILEVEKYKLVLTVKEMKDIEEKLKTKSEKENFIDFLKKLKNISDDKLIQEKDIEDVYNYALNESMKIKYFYSPIEFSNQELFYYKLYILLMMNIANIKNDIKISKEEKKDYILNKKDIASIIIDKKVLDNEKIVNDEDKMNIFTIILLYETLDDKKESINLNRLLQTEPVEYDELIKYVKKNNLGAIVINDNINKIGIKNTYGEENIIAASDVCLKNIQKNGIENVMDSFKLNTLNSLLKKNNIKDYDNKIREFLNVIVDSIVYKEAISKLFPENHKYLLGSNLEDIKTCINSRLKFYPYHGLGNSGLTDKFSCYSYIPIFYYIYGTVKDYIFLSIGAVIENSLHEINHMNQDLLFFYENNEKLFYSPKRDYILGEDGGENLEVLLFGRKIITLTKLECYYLLNEENYKQSLEDFRTNFNNLYNYKVTYSQKVKFLKDGKIFEEFFHDIKNYKDENEFGLHSFGEINTKTKISIKCESKVLLTKNHCKLGIN